MECAAPGKDEAPPPTEASEESRLDVHGGRTRHGNAAKARQLEAEAKHLLPSERGGEYGVD